MPVDRTIRGRVAVAGVGETPYYKHGQSPDAQFKLTLMAILAAAEDAGLDPREIDGFATYANDANDAGRLATALGCRELRYANMVFGGGGGGGSGAVGNAAAAIHAGLADCVVVYRGLAQGQGVRFGQAGGYPTQIAGEPATWIPYGVMSPAQMFAMRTTRLMHEHGIERSALRAIALASYHHAQQNPRAVMRGRPLDEAGYDASRWIVEPFKLFDCCLENDGAAALILVPAERAKDLRKPPCFVLGAAHFVVLVDLVVHHPCGIEEPVADGFPFLPHHRTDLVPFLLVLLHLVLQLLHVVLGGKAFHVADERLLQSGVLSQVVVP